MNMICWVAPSISSNFTSSIDGSTTTGTTFFFLTGAFLFWAVMGMAIRAAAINMSIRYFFIVL